MTALNFFKRLTNRTLDTNIRSNLSIKPALTPDMIPDKFQGYYKEEVRSNALILHPMAGRNASSNFMSSTSNDLSSNWQRSLPKDDADGKETNNDLPNIKLLHSIKKEQVLPAIIHTSSYDTKGEGEKIDAVTSNLDRSEKRIHPLVEYINETINMSTGRSSPQHELDPNSFVDTVRISSNKENTKNNISLSNTMKSDTSSHTHSRINDNKNNSEDKYDNNENIVTTHYKSTNLSKLTDDLTNTEKILKRDSLTFSSSKITKKDQEKKADIIGYSNNAEIFARDRFKDVKIQPQEVDQSDSVNSLDNLEPTVTVNIGRIEVKAIFPYPNTTTNSKHPATFSPTLTLKEYLKKRAED
jgi:hypothetical protein